MFARNWLRSFIAIAFVAGAIATPRAWGAAIDESTSSSPAAMPSSVADTISDAAADDNSDRATSTSSIFADAYDCDACCDPLWIVRGGAVILHRSTPANLTIFSDTTTGAEIANARQFHFGWAAGPDIGVMRRLSPGDYLEVRYFNITGFVAQQNIVAPGAFNINTDPPVGSPFGANIDATYGSALFNTEVNFRRRFSPQATWLAGFRTIQVRDDFAASVDLAQPGVHANFDLRTHNFLYGAQTGLDLNLWNRGGPLSIDGLFKAGIFGNSANQRTSDISTFNGTQVFQANLNDGRGQVAFVGEIALTGVYRVTDRFSLRAGYQLLWIDGVALATDQFPALNFPAQNGIHTTGTLFYHGALVGGELRF